MAMFESDFCCCPGCGKCGAAKKLEKLEKMAERALSLDSEPSSVKGMSTGMSVIVSISDWHRLLRLARFIVRGRK